MIPINNSDTAWLIVADYNQENGKYHEELREDVLNPDVNQWYFQYKLRQTIGGESYYNVGYSQPIGGEHSGRDLVGEGSRTGSLVGGHIQIGGC